ncbi:hypothetical protein AB1Y20_023089 [Prymnesium parvum]|uniref:Uncharacterized protein n=1 Tax=Prymnesium parvum TaxID=97485 RepID=A0AB34III2_PRYPA
MPSIECADSFVVPRCDGSSSERLQWFYSHGAAIVEMLDGRFLQVVDVRQRKSGRVDLLLAAHTDSDAPITRLSNPRHRGACCSRLILGAMGGDFAHRTTDEAVRLVDVEADDEQIHHVLAEPLGGGARKRRRFDVRHFFEQYPPCSLSDSEQLAYRDEQPAAPPRHASGEELAWRLVPHDLDDPLQMAAVFFKSRRLREAAGYTRRRAAVHAVEEEGVAEEECEEVGHAVERLCLAVRRDWLPSRPPEDTAALKRLRALVAGRLARGAAEARGAEACLCHVSSSCVGTRFYAAGGPRYVGEPLQLRLQPHQPHEGEAVAVYAASRLVGHVERHGDARAISRVAERVGGVRLVGEVGGAAGAYSFPLRVSFFGPPASQAQVLQLLRAQFGVRLVQEGWFGREGSAGRAARAAGRVEDDCVTVVGQRTWEERDAELRRRAIVLE